MNEINNSNSNNENEPKKNVKLPPNLSKEQVAPGSEPVPNLEAVALAWSPADHDQKIASKLSEETKSKCRLIISRAYTEWKKNLERRIARAQRNPNDPKKQLTQQDVIATVYDLHGVVAREADKPEMFEWRSYTLEILEDLIGVIILTRFHKNLFTEFIPEKKASDALVIPQRHAFESYEEFDAIPFLQKFREKEGFIGFLREEKRILALFVGGEVTVAGLVASPKGVEKLPTRFQMMKELERSEQ